MDRSLFLYTRLLNYLLFVSVFFIVSIDSVKRADAFNPGGGGVGGVHTNGVQAGSGGDVNNGGGGGGGGIDSSHQSIVGTGGAGGAGKADPLDSLEPAQGGTTQVINNSSDVYNKDVPNRTGQSGNNGTSSGGSGAGGAVGAIINAATYVIDLTTAPDGIGGGNGGPAGVGINGVAAGGGGGVGVIFNGQTLTVGEGSGITGGFGQGAEGNILPTTTVIGGGGVGLILNSGTLNNNGLIFGGSGGGGAIVATDMVFPGGSGSGIYMLGNTTINNSSLIATGGIIEGPFTVVPVAIIGNGDNILINNKAGAAIRGSIYNFKMPDAQNESTIILTGNNNKIINAGDIVAYDVADDSLYKPAVIFAGNDNTLELWGGQSLSGAVQATGTNNSLILGGETAGTFKLDDIEGSNVQSAYTGFVNFTKNGSSNWSVTGATNATQEWSIDEGTLSLTADGSLEKAVSVKLAATLDISGITTSDTVINNLSVTADSAIELGAQTLSIVNTADTTLPIIISGENGNLNLTGTHFILTADSTFTGTTHVKAGILQLGDGGTSGSLASNIALDATTQLIIDRSDDVTVDGLISGDGKYKQTGAGAITFTKDNSYTGDTEIAAGSLFIHGNQAAATGLVSTVSGVTLGGGGVLGGDVTIVSGAKLLSSVATNIGGEALEIKGKLTVDDGGILHYDYDGSKDNTVHNLGITVGGDLDLGTGTLIEVVPGAVFPPGVYNLITYAGTWNQNIPTLVPVADHAFSLRTSMPNKIDLVMPSFDPSGKLTFWSPSGTPGSHPSGGAGTWQLAGTLDNWADGATGARGAFLNNEYPVFETVGGIVTVDNSNGDIIVSGIQFAADGYDIIGSSIELKGIGTSTDVPIRVGSGSAQDAGMVAVIGSELIGDGKLHKTDMGILKLKGTNTYKGGTLVSGGVLNIRSDNNLGQAGEELELNSGTLQLDDDVTLARPITLGEESGTFDTQAHTGTVTSVIEGDGSLNKIGSGKLILQADNTYSGKTNIKEGSLAAQGGGNTLSASELITVDANFDISSATANIAIKSLAGGAAGTVTLGDKVLNITAGSSSDFAGVISGTGEVHVSGGTQILSGNNDYSGATEIASGATVQLGNGGTTGDLKSDVNVRGTLSFNRSDVFNVGFAIKGDANLKQIGTGTTVFSQDYSAFTGVTDIDNGILAVNNQLGGVVNINNNATLKGIGSVGSLTNSGIISPGSDAGVGTLTIKGDYTGNPTSVVLIRSELGGDSSPTTLLHITGATAGNSGVKVENINNGAGALTQSGIKIIQVDGSSVGTFSLLGDFVTDDGQHAVVAGAYAYTLHQNSLNSTDGNWYLRSALEHPNPKPGPDPKPKPDPKPDPKPKPEPTPRYQPGVPIYSASSSILSRLNSDITAITLRERMGARYPSPYQGYLIEQGDGIGTMTGFARHQGQIQLDNNVGWLRFSGDYSRNDLKGSTTQNSYRSNSWLMQMGLDGHIYGTDKGDLIGSIWLHYLNSRSDIYSYVGDGALNVDGYGMGAAATWYGDSGFYLDMTSQVTWYSSEMTSKKVGNLIDGKTSSQGYGLSIEFGKQIPIDEYWSVTPQAQLSYSSMQFDGFTDVFGVKTNQNDQFGTLGRLGLSVDYDVSWQDEKADNKLLKLYGVFGVLNQFQGQNHTVYVANNEFQSGETGATLLELGAGLQYGWGGGRHFLYGEARSSSSVKGFGSNYEIGGNIGYRIKW